MADGYTGTVVAAGSIMKSFMAQYDLIIRNGEIFDGSGGPSFRADVAVNGGVIEKVAAKGR